MPQVPYTDYPTERPSGSPMPYQTPAGATPDAFGASVGQATQAFAGKVGEIGNMLEKHALTLQNQKDEAENNTAVTAAIQAEGEITNKFNQLSGRAAQDALPRYYKELEAARTEIRRGLTSPFVQKMYDQATMRQFGYATINGSRHAATQLRQYNNTAATSRLENTLEASQRLEDSQFEQSISSENLKGILRSSDAKDLPPEKLDEIVREKQQRAYSERIKKEVNVNPDRADQLLRKWGDKLSPSELGQLKAQTNNAMITRDSVSISTQVVTEGKGAFSDLLRSGVETGSKDPYNTTLDNGRWTGGPVKLTNMTVAEVRQLQDKMRTPENRALYGQGRGSSALGAPQIVSATLDRLIASGVVKPEDKFNEDTQDKIIATLAKERGPNVAGLRQEWEGLKNVSAERIQEAWAAQFGPNANVSVGDRTALVARSREMAEAMAKKRGFSEYDTARAMDAAEKATDARYGRVMADQRDALNGDKFTVMNAVLNPEKLPTTKEELMHALGAEGQAAYNRLPHPVQQAINDRLVKNSTAVPMTPEKWERYQTLVGKAGDPEQHREFVDNIDKYVAEGWRPREAGHLLALAQRIHKGAQSKVPIDSAMHQLQAEGAFDETSIKSPKSTTRDYFRGVLTHMIEQDMAERKAPPNQQRIRELGAAAMKQVVTNKGGWFGPTYHTKDPKELMGLKTLDTTVPPEAAAVIREEAKKDKREGALAMPGALFKMYQRNKHLLQGLEPPTPPAEAPRSPTSIEATPENYLF